MKRNLRTKINARATNMIERVGFIINPFLLNFKNERNRLLIFCFHGIFESEKERSLNHVDPQQNMNICQFNDFVEYFLDQKYEFISPENFTDDLPGNKAYAMITFDDGYFNNSYVFDSLKKFNVPAHIFISTGNIMENKTYWWDIIYRNRIKKGSDLESIRNEQRFLKTMKHDEVSNYILENFGLESFTPWSDIDRPFSEDEIRKIAGNNLISFGSHSHNHGILINYESQGIEYELIESKRIINELTGKDPLTIAYPNGDFNNHVLSLSEQLGFKYAFTIEEKPNRIPDKNSNFVCLNRFMTNISDINEFGSFCRLGYEPEGLYNGLRFKVRKLFLKR